MGFYYTTTLNEDFPDFNFQVLIYFYLIKNVLDLIKHITI